MKMKLPDVNGYVDKNGWTDDIEGAAAEMAWAKLRDRYWSYAVNTFKSGDVGNVQVRSASRPTDSLIVRAKDSDIDVFVLMIGRSPTFRAVGWMRGKAAKQEKWERGPNNRPPAWFVPQSELNTIRLTKA